MTRTAVIAGVGPGLGESLAQKSAAEGCQVALFARSADYIDELAEDLPGAGRGWPSRLISQRLSRSETDSRRFARHSGRSISS